MSLDVRLKGQEREEDVRCHFCMHTHKEVVTETYFESNITHNLGKMAAAAGFYRAMWFPDEVGFERAAELIEPLTKGVEELKAHPEKYKAFDSSNGWGVYDDFVPWVERYLQACKDHPNAQIQVSR